MKSLLKGLVFCLVLHSSTVHAQFESLNKAVEQFNEAMVKVDTGLLDRLTDPGLSYGHSNGNIENKSGFISSLSNGKYKFLSIDIKNQTTADFGDIVIVRHDLIASTHDQGKPEKNIRLHVLMVWKFHEMNWILIARQAVKI